MLQKRFKLRSVESSGTPIKSPRQLCHAVLSVTVSNGFWCILTYLDRRHQNIVVRPENCLQLWTQKCGCFGHLCTEQCQCRLPMDIANADYAEQFQRFKFSLLHVFCRNAAASITNLRLCKPPHLLLLHYL